MRAANGKGALPWQAAEIGLCERFHCLPSQLRREDLGALLQGAGLLDLYRDLRKMLEGEKLSASSMDRIGKALQTEIDYGRRSKHHHQDD